MELTSEIKAKIFGLYLGSPIRVSQNKLFIDDTINNGSTIHGHEFTIWDVHDTGYGSKAFDVRLILKPISEISDEDAITVAKMLGCEVELDEKIYPPNPMLRNIPKLTTDQKLSNIGKRELNILDNTVGVNPMEFDIADFLRSKSYALPYMGIDLFEAGIAILKNKIQP